MAGSEARAVEMWLLLGVGVPGAPEVPTHSAISQPGCPAWWVRAPHQRAVLGAPQGDRMRRQQRVFRALASDTTQWGLLRGQNMFNTLACCYFTTALNS